MNQIARFSILSFGFEIFWQVSSFEYYCVSLNQIFLVEVQVYQVKENTFCVLQNISCIFTLPNLVKAINEAPSVTVSYNMYIHKSMTNM